MKKVILVDGNNLLFRSYYATAYSGNSMKNSKGFPTNALYGFTNMINKILTEETPSYMLVAFDKGKTFRHEKYKDYKAGRIQMPEELKKQFPVAKKLLSCMGIKWFEIDNYEADDIIGTMSEKVNTSEDYEALIVSSDRDLLQLITDKVTVKLLKSKDYIIMNKETFKKEYGLLPERIIDIKALQGDSSDNIPGVKGIGEKTALSLLQEYDTLENVYANIAYIKSSVATKLINGKEDAFNSKDLATIYKEVPLEFEIEDTKLQNKEINDLRAMYEELEFYSLIKNLKKNNVKKEYNIIEVSCFEDLKEIKTPFAFYVELDKSNYHLSNMLGMGIYDGTNAYYVRKEMIRDVLSFLNTKEKYTYDLKKHYVVLKNNGLILKEVTFDSIVAAYLLNYNVKDDAAYLANYLGYEIPFYEYVSKAKTFNYDEIKRVVVQKAAFIYETKEELFKEMEKEDCLYLFNEIEMPLSLVLGDMEYEGIRVNKTVLKNMNSELEEKIEELSKQIYECAGMEFNISSPKQLGEVLFETLKIGKGKKTKSGYSTDKSVLVKYKDRHPVVPLILEHRMLSKLQSTYTKGLENFILNDDKIHTIYTQTLTRTGRLSSIEPNLQNIPARTTYGKLIRKAFIPENGCVLLSSDYSQIELRVFAHFSEIPSWIEAFKNNMDIHKRTAMDIFEVSEEQVTPLMRSQAKAVNFGILYGMSSFGLSEDLGISVVEAKKFINNYFEKYSGTKTYMDNVIKDAYEKGYVTTLMNRKRRIEELNNTNYMIRNQGERIALNTPIQGTSADIIKKAMISVYNEFNKRNLKSKMLLQVHDELIFNVYKEELNEVKEIVSSCMNNAYKLKVPLKVEMAAGNNWYEAK